MADELLNHPVVDHARWIEQRKTLLAEEKRFMRQQDEFRARQRALPWERVDKRYTFDSTAGKVTLADLFAGRSQLFVKHFMLAPGQTSLCVGCSLEVDHVTGLLPHIGHHDISYVAIARAPLEQIEAVRARMGWRFEWVSSYGSDFNYDFFASFRPEDIEAGRAFSNYEFTKPPMEDLSGNSVFYKDDAGAIFHTYSTFGRGGEQFLGIYSFFDIVPKGRQENGPNHSLPDWARPHDQYDSGGSVDAMGAHTATRCGCANTAP